MSVTFVLVICWNNLVDISSISLMTYAILSIGFLKIPSYQ